MLGLKMLINATEIGVLRHLTITVGCNNKVILTEHILA